MKILSFLKSHEQVLVLSLGYLVVGGLCFGIGQMTAASSSGPEIRVEQVFAPLNNIANSPDNQSGTVLSGKSGETDQTTANPNSPAKGTEDCKGQIKGNISASKDKVYHVIGSSAYNRTDPEQCFNTEAEAQAAGFRKAGSK